MTPTVAPENANAANYEKPVAHTETLGSFIGKGLLIATGAYHTRQRRMIQPSFHRKKLSSLTERMDQEINEALDEMVKKEQNIDGNVVIEVNQTMREITFRLMVKSIFGDSLSEEQIVQFFQNFTQLQDFLNQLVKVPFLMKWASWTGKIKAYEKLAESDNELILSVLDGLE